jgi:hypothetical protein
VDPTGQIVFKLGPASSRNCRRYSLPLQYPSLPT